MTTKARLDETLSQRLYHATFEHAAIGIGHVAPDGRWLKVNDRLCDMFGYSREAMAGLSFQDITYPDDLASDLSELERLVRGDIDRYSLEKRYVRSDGSVFWGHLTVAALRDAVGEISLFISTIEDIDDRRNAHDALAESEARFRAIQETSPDGFMVFAAMRGPGGEIEDFRWTYANAAAERITGRPAAELIGCRLLDEMPGNLEAGLFDAYRRVVDTGEPWSDIFHYSGETFDHWFRANAARVGDGFAISFADITAQRLGEERLRHLIDNVVGFIGVLSPDGTLLEANQPALDVAGIAREDVIGKPFWDCFWWNFDPAVQARVREAVAAAAAGERVRYDAEIRVAENARIIIDFQLAPTLDSRGRVIDLIPSGMDITDRKKGEQHRELLLGELSHRVKNMLANIQAMAAHTIRDAGDLESFSEAFSGRLKAIAACHDLLVERNHAEATLEQLILSQVGPYAGDRVRAAGPPTTIPGPVAHTFALILHEMATNASKYGSLSNDAGTLEIDWHPAPAAGEGSDAPGAVIVNWRECGGPPVTPPTRRGFGSRLIERSLAHAVGGSAEIDYKPDGVLARFTLPLEA